MKETKTLYRKVGKKYVKHDDYLDERGLPCGLYLFYNPNYLGEHKAMMNMLHYAKVHDIRNVDNFCNLFVAHEKEIAEAVEKAIRQGGYSIRDITNTILTELSNIEK